jgi:hypothetical protein
MNTRSDLSRRASALLAGLSALMLAVGCATTRSDANPQSRNDRLLSDRVDAALESDPVFFYRHVDVRTDNGKVILSGYVWSSEPSSRPSASPRTCPASARSSMSSNSSAMAATAAAAAARGRRRGAAAELSARRVEHVRGSQRALAHVGAAFANACQRHGCS